MYLIRDIFKTTKESSAICWNIIKIWDFSHKKNITGTDAHFVLFRIEYFDDLAKEEGSPVDDTFRMTWEPAAIAHKNLLIDGIQILCDEFSRPTQQTQPGMDSNESSPQVSVSIYR